MAEKRFVFGFAKRFMPVKWKMWAELARLGMWNSQQKDFALSMVAKMSLGQ